MSIERKLSYKISTVADVQGLKALNRALQQNQAVLSSVASSLRQLSHANSLIAARMEKMGRVLRKLNGRMVRTQKVTKEATVVMDRMSTSLGYLMRHIRRFVTYAVLFTVMHGIKRGFDSMTRAAIQFNQTLEEGALALAGITMATGKFADAQGRVLPVSEALPAALAASQRQLRLLQRETLSTTGHFMELAAAMQEGIAPGLAAGMSLDEIRLLTRRVAEAAATLGVQQRQLPTELRALLAGQIRPQTTRIATALGITNEDVNRWKEMGIFAEEVLSRFEAFAVIEKPMADTISMMASRVKDALQAIMGEAGMGFFNEVKGLLKDVLSLLTDEEGISPSAVSAIRSLFDGVEGVIKSIRSYLQGLSLEDLRGFGDAFSTMFTTVATVLEVLLFRVGGMLMRIIGSLKSVANILRSGWVRTLITVGTLMWVLHKGWTTISALTVKVNGLLAKMLLSKKAMVVANAGWIAGLSKSAMLLGKVGIGIAVAAPVVDRLARGFGLIGETMPTISQAMTAGFLGVLSPSRAGKYVSDIEKGFAEIEDRADGVVRKGVIPWSQKLREIDDGMVTVGDSMARQQAALQKIVENARNLHSRYVAIRNITLATGTAGDMQMRNLDAQAQIQQRTQQILSEQEARINRIKSIDLERQGILEGMANLNERNRRGFFRVVAAEQQRLVVIDRIKSLEEDLEKATTMREKSAIISALAGQKSLLYDLNKAVEDHRGLTQAAQDAAIKYFTLSRQRNVAQTELNTLKEDEAKIINTILGELSLQLANEIELANKRKERKLQSEKHLALEAKVADLQRAGAHTSEVEVARAQLRLAQENSRAKLRAQDLALQIQALEAQKESAHTDQEREAIQRHINLLWVEAHQEAEQYRHNIEQINKEKEEHQKHLTGTFGEGMMRSMNKFVQQAPTAFSAGLDLMKDTLDGFVDLVSDAITDAFDPTSDTSLKERIGNFIRDIGKQLTQLAVKMAMAQAFGAAFGVPKVGGKAGSLAQGGPVRGYAAGGDIRPAGIPASDTVPIWATPGEFMMKVDAVRKYGADVMDAINQGLIDPMALRGLRHSRRSSRGFPGRMGYAEGGEISPAHTVPVGSQAGPIAAYVVANDEAVDRILAGGKGAMLKFFKDNASTLKGLLR